MDQQAKKDQTERVTGLGRRTRDSKVESNDSPEISDRGETSDIPGLIQEADMGKDYRAARSVLAGRSRVDC